MEQIKRLRTKILFPHIAFIVAFVPFTAALLIYTFAYENANQMITYGSYFLSAYALTIVCARIPVLYKNVKAAKQKNKYIHLYTSNVGLRVKLSLYGALSMNLLYALMQLFLGFINHSVWFYALAGYYGLLGVMRFFLLREARKNRLGKNLLYEYLLYRLCGVLLAVMNLSLTAIVFYIVWKNRGFEYHYIMTIAMATYTFFTLTMAIINIIRYRKYKSPVISAAKGISLAAALVSMLSLETAMLTAFGDENDAVFRHIMTASTGGAVCVAVLVMAIFMIVGATKAIKEIKGASRYGE